MRLLTFLLLASCSFADVLELKNGERLEGTFKQADSAGGVLIEVGGQPIMMPMAKVRALYFGAAPKAEAPKPSAAREALDALKALNSVTTVGVAYREYASRVLDAKVQVDRYLRVNDESAAKPAISVAMRYYEVASQVWGLQFNHSPDAFAFGEGIARTLREDESFRECAPVQSLIAELASRPKHKGLTYSPSMLPYMLGQQPGKLWSCGSAKINEAEELLAKQPRLN